MLVKLHEHIYKWSLEKHPDWKPQLLDLIDQTKRDLKIGINESNYYYDFNVSGIEHKKYAKLFFHCISEPIEQYAKLYGCFPKKSKPDCWFQQYVMSGKFGWHGHNRSVALIYFLEMPDPSYSTEFLNYGQFDVKEGDVLIWPSWLIHRSPVIKDETRKTIIATNIELEVDRGWIENNDWPNVNN